MLKKLAEFDQFNNDTVNQRLETIRVDLRDKIKGLATNVDMLYQLIDKKIAVILSEISRSPESEASL